MLAKNLINQCDNMGDYVKGIQVLMSILKGSLSREDLKSECDINTVIVEVKNVLIQNQALLTKKFDTLIMDLTQLKASSMIINTMAAIDRVNLIIDDKLDYSLFFPATALSTYLGKIDDIEEIKEIISALYDLVLDMEVFDGLLEDRDEREEQERNPSNLYKALLGILPKEESQTLKSGPRQRVFNIGLMKKATTYFELWRYMDYQALIDLLAWGTEYELSIPVSPDDANPDKDIYSLNYDLEISRLRSYLHTLKSVKKQIQDLAPDGFDYDVDFEPISVFNRIRVLEMIINYLIRKTHEENTISVNMLKLEERNRILSNLSHSIKNILKSVIDPLENLKAELPEKAGIFDNAIRGANVIREMVNAINSSYKTTLEDLIWDISHPEREGIILQDMIRDSLFYSVSNMFDFRYFPVFAENYFPMSLSKDEYDNISDKWREVSAAHEIDKLKAYLKSYMFSLELNLDESAGYKVGNDKSSAIKLMILFQEIIFNAVKYASFVSKEQRSIRVSLTEHDTKLRFTVENTWKPEVKAKTTGVGKLVIENFAKVLNTEPVIETSDTTYTITMEFNNFWRNNAEDTLH